VVISSSDSDYEAILILFEQSYSLEAAAQESQKSALVETMV
jgi:hypothetical protein